jgi:glycosyltransferase involved in cell wall biosynthesis
MPTWNGARFLDQALNSIVAQNADDIEVILVDDGSTDQTLTIADAFSTALSLRIEALAHRGNWVAGTNRGMSLARGAYICWLHQDDVWHPSRLRVLRELTRQNPDVDLFIHPVSFINDAGRNVGRWRCPLPSGMPLTPAEVLPHLLVQNFIATPAPVFKSSAAVFAGSLDERLWFTADWDYWLRLTSHGRTYYHPARLSDFRVHRGSQSMNRIDDIATQLSLVIDRHLECAAKLLPDASAVTLTSRFSAKLNVALFRLAGRDSSRVPPLLHDFLMLGPSGWYRYFRDSRILERVGSRVRAGCFSRTVRCDLENGTPS